MFTSGALLELMHRPDIPATPTPAGHEHLGYAHLAMSGGSPIYKDGHIIGLAWVRLPFELSGKNRE